MNNISISKIDSKNGLYIIFGMILIIIIGALGNTYFERKLEKFETTTGTITEFKFTSSGYSGSYKYEVNGIEYMGTFISKFFKCSNGVEGCVGESFNVKYSSSDFSISEIDLKEFNNKKFYKPHF